jgi:Putative abortive phage resistance protein AbiGi, antitoxin
VTSLQRYVSAELSHFAGRGKPESEQYDTLVKIVRSGTLLAPGGVPPGATEEDGTPIPPGIRLEINPGESVAEKFRGTIVCFCDIPVEDLGIHTEKYSRFGLSFRKDFLVARGASPVFYLDDRAPVDSLMPSLSWAPAAREEIFDIGLRLTHEVLLELQFGRTGPSGERIEPCATEGHDVSRIRDIQSFLGFHVFAFLKPFDASTADTDPANFYMEREWRVLGNVDFAVENVYRVFLPQEYARRFRDDLPEYAGQLTFV